MRNKIAAAYGLATTYVAIAALISVMLADALKPVPCLIFVLAVVGSARTGGLRVGAFATVISAPVIDFFFLPAHHLSSTLQEGIPMLIFIVAGLIISRWIGNWFEAQHRLAEANALLESRVAERTAALAAANEEMTKFAYTVSHDLRQPLRTIHMFAQLLLKESKPDETEAEYLRLISDSAVSLTRMIQDVLDYSRAIEVEVHRVPVDAVGILEQIRQECQLAFKDENAALHVNWLPGFEGDPILIKQLLQNLVLNAVKYHRPEAPPVIEISATRDGDTWTFIVADNGTGVSEEDQKRLFKPFARISKNSGSGIGLATCQRIIERHGGRIWVESVLGEGSLFKFTLPAIICSRALNKESCLQNPGGCTRCPARRELL